MYIVTVTFEINAERLEDFRALMLKQAANSLDKESGCRQFDVCFGFDRPDYCFLYEKYDDRAAFEKHLASVHFKEFDTAVQPLVISKRVSIWIEEK